MNPSINKSLMGLSAMEIDELLLRDLIAATQTLSDLNYLKAVKISIKE
jgi:hypothetical protein